MCETDGELFGEELAGSKECALGMLVAGSEYEESRLTNAGLLAKLHHLAQGNARWREAGIMTDGAHQLL